MKLIKQNDLLFVVISSLVLTVFWIIFSLYHAHADSTISETQSIQISPIPGHFDKTVVEQLKTRTKVDPDLENVTIASNSPSPTITITPAASITTAPVSSGAAAKAKTP